MQSYAISREWKTTTFTASNATVHMQWDGRCTCPQAWIECHHQDHKGAQTPWRWTKLPSSEMTDVTLFTNEVNTLIDADAKMTKMVPHRRSMQPPVLSWWYSRHGHTKGPGSDIKWFGSWLTVDGLGWVRCQQRMSIYYAMQMNWTYERTWQWHYIIWQLISSSRSFSGQL